MTVTLSFGGTANRGCSQGAVAPFDYCAPGLLTIAAGQHSETTSLTTYTTGSDNETVLITATASGYVPSGTAAITINTNDSASLTLSAAHATISEPNGTTTLTVSVPPGAEPTSNLTVSLTHSGTAIHPDDYTVGAVTIQVGQRSGTATLRVVNDTAEERNETIVLVATAPGYVSSPPLSITLEDGGDTALALTANTRSASEGGQVFLTVAVPPGREPLSDRIVTLVHTGSATHPADYTIESLVIPAGRGSGSATLNVLADSVHEGTETITLIASATGYRSSSPLSITVENDGDTPLTLTANTTNVTEGGQVFITVAVPPGAEPTSDLTIALTHSGTATPTDDYTVGTLVIPAGRDSGSATLSTLHDQLYEGVETISLVASATSATRPNPFSLPPVARYASSPPLSLTLEDGDRAALTLTAAHATVSEPDSITTLTVTVPAGAAPPTGLRVTLTHSGTATYSGDYTVGILRIPANQNSGTTTLAVVDDTVPEGAETIILVATAPGYADSPPLTIALHNAEESPVSPFQFTFDQPRYTVTEGATPVPITIRVRPAPDRALEIPLRLTRAGGADPSDYYGIPDAIAFEPGTSTAIVHVGAHADDIDDPGETIQMSLEYLLVGVRSGPIASATIEISQHHTNPHFSASLQVLSALVAQSAAGAAQTGIEARFERHRQRRGQEGNWVPAIPTLPQFQQFSEAGSLGSPLGPPRRGTPRLATPEALLSNYSFDLPLTSLLPGASWSPAIWGQARLHHFPGSLQNAALDYQARRSSAQLGLDFYSREDILVGVAFTRSWGDLEYTDDGVPGILTGTINTFHPYLYWQPNDRLSLWAMAAFGGGPLRISEPGRQHRFPSDFSMFSGGLRAPVLRTSSQELSFKADLSLALLNVDAQAADIPSVPAASSTRSRLLTEWRFTPLMETDRSFSIQADLGARFDGGDAHTGAGAEAGFQIAFLDMRRGLGRARPHAGPPRTGRARVGR